MQEGQSYIPPLPLPFFTTLGKSPTSPASPSYSSFLSTACLALTEVGRPLIWVAEG